MFSWYHTLIVLIPLVAICSIVARAYGWTTRQWMMREFIVVLVYPIAINIGTTIWFTWGTVVDLKRLVRDLAARGRNDLDNGMVDGHVSLADRAAFAEKKANAEKLRGD